MATASRSFQVMAKPIGAVCNLDCAYCYYLEKKDLYPRRQSFRMVDDVLESYIVQHIEACPDDLIFFAWHGGEPTVLGLDYFQRIVELQRRHQPSGRRIQNGIQTNGMLIDEEWCRFLAAERFQVGLSVDGPRELHDPYRITKSGDSTNKRVMQSFQLLKRHGIECDMLCVVHQKNVHQAASVYRFFRDNDVKFLQFLPLVARKGDSGVSAKTVPAEAYGVFLCTVFDAWIKHDVGRIAIQNFEEALRPFLGIEHSICISRETCGDVVVVEHNGDVYCCDHFVSPEYRLGNIAQTPLVELLESPALADFGRRKEGLLPGACRACEFLGSCNGGCPKDRFTRTKDGEDGLNYLCAGFQRFFDYSRPYLRLMAAARKLGKSPEQLMGLLQSEGAGATRQTGRNDPCPCGSGRKYKKCCLGKPSFERLDSRMRDRRE